MNDEKRKAWKLLFETFKESHKTEEEIGWRTVVTRRNPERRPDLSDE